jgi:serine kinase of HPr protein (carbohydrate metabolism regulator)
MSEPDRLTVQATCVSLDGTGLLLRGRPGAGKSDLALRLVDAGAFLVADDLTLVVREAGALIARLPDGAPPETRGRLEIRGIGLVPVQAIDSAPLKLVVDLKPQSEIERLPRPAHWPCLGLEVPIIALDPHPASAAAKLRLVVRAGTGFIMPPP